ncbi:MAG: hydrogenase expression/formation protein HypE [Marinilabiliales bacterium]
MLISNTDNYKNMKNEKIILGHGSGGQLTHELIHNIFMKHFDNDYLNQAGDSAIADFAYNKIAVTTDSYVVDPIFFTNGNIGKLAVAGTVNDIAVSGAKPLYITAAFIIEEGLSLNELEEIVKTMSDEAKKAGVKIISGDTKVVEKGKCDKIFINTTGVGFFNNNSTYIQNHNEIKPGDKIIINGSIGDHGMAIMAERNQLNIKAKIESDCASLNHLIEKILSQNNDIKFIRDVTRGGLATVLTEIVENKNFGIEIDETKIKVKDTVRGICELLGFDPMYVANEGKIVCVVSEKNAENVLKIMKSDPHGKDAEIIGEIIDSNPGKAWITTNIGGRRILYRLSGEQLPRIC